jgi:prophage antirepressor-like protein
VLQLLPNNPISLTFTYENRRIRVAGKPEAPLFVVKDVCRAIGLRYRANLLGYNEQVMAYVATTGGIRETLCTRETGLKELARRCRMPDAQRFLDWVQHEVLPSIRGMSLGPKAESSPTPSRLNLLEEAERWLGFVERACAELQALGGIHQREELALRDLVSLATSRLRRSLRTGIDSSAAQPTQEARSIAEYLVERGIDAGHLQIIERLAAGLFRARHFRSPEQRLQSVDARSASVSVFGPDDVDLVEEAIALALPEQPTSTAHKATDLVPSGAPESKVPTSMEANL